MMIGNAHEISERNQWVVERLRKDFPEPDYEINCELFQFNNAYGVSIRNNLMNKRHAVLIEKMDNTFTKKIGINYMQEKDKAYTDMVKIFKDKIDG